MHIFIGQLGSGWARRALGWPEMHLLQEADAQSLHTQCFQQLMSPALSLVHAPSGKVVCAWRISLIATRESEACLQLAAQQRQRLLACAPPHYLLQPRWALYVPGCLISGCLVSPSTCTPCCSPILSCCCICRPARVFR
jgi:hypothetical protein